MDKKIKVSKYVAGKIERNKSDFIQQTFRAGGSGGQHQNKTESGVRLIDKETGLRAECREHAEQPQNKKAAFLKLIDLLIEHYSAEETKLREKYDLLKEVRVYKEKGDLCIDHTTGKKYSYKDVLEGKSLGKILEDRQKMLLEPSSHLLS